ncbi:hypothetical protein F993_01993 [Acinetobacter proteolyticus]|uniref:Uncharacterized protein n=1 Tax=Acinetobacter proteolyticus TaxID=1776741 RepID=A0ABP2TPF4_9GAMM|nr:hypothetical protein [Acinetobacter proteolyticus]ENU23839.1 hypothetical protein F993_01993 [Acinetobacter proteolyticus]
MGKKEMTNHFKKLLISLIVVPLLSCSLLEEKTCVHRFNQRVLELSKDLGVQKAISRIEGKTFCGNLTYTEFYNHVDVLLEDLNDTQKQDFYTVLFFAEFHRNENGGEYVEFLNKNNINIYKQYKRKISDQKLLAKMKYKDEEWLNIKALGEMLH